uniref:DNA damage-induced apoptosis suppressor protein n=1 Tax=Otolemur garnettii TaxID=30611 RepID=H0XKE5_OTOGA
MNKRRKFLLASVLALQNSSFIYPACQKCLSRVILLSKRFNCPKCGAVGEDENVSYRYKLSLQVVESNKLFVITIFGSCLDTFFGLTATDLHKYLQESNKISETLDNDTTQNLLTKAVETCFVGRTFNFGVTNFENEHGQVSDVSYFLQPCPDHKREVKTLVACQIVLPDPSLVGFTVIDYFHQFLQTFRKLHCGSQVPNSHLLALDHSNSGLSSICGSDNTSYFFEFCSRDNFSRFWQPSLELTSISSHLTDNDDFLAAEQSKVFGILHQNRKCISNAEASGSKSCHDPIQGSWSLVSYMDKKSTAEKLSEEFDLQASHPSASNSNHHEIGFTDSNLLPLKMGEPLESSDTKSFYNTVEIKNRYSQHEIQCYHDVNTPTSLQERSACCPLSSRRFEELASSSQNCDPENWDDLPFSESLDKFLAAIENEIPVTQTNASNRKHVDNDINKLKADHSKLTMSPQRTTTLHTPPVALRSSQVTIKANSSKDNFFNCEANPSPSVQKESQSDNTEEAISISNNRKDTWGYFLPNTYLSALFSSSNDSRTAVTLKKTVRILSHRERDHPFLNIKCKESQENSLSEMNEKLTSCSRKHNNIFDLHKLENKQSYRWPKNQDDSFTVCRKLTYPLETLCNSLNTSTSTMKEKLCGHTSRNITQSYPTGYEGSYNASADLFDDIVKEMDIATEITKKSQAILSQCGMSLAESHPSGSDFSPRSISENASLPSQKRALQSVSARRHPVTFSPLPHFQSDSEYNFEDSQDFVPCSQSTPITGFHQTRIYGINGPLKKLPTFYTDFNVNYEKTRISPECDKQLAIPSCPKSTKPPRQQSRSPITSGIAEPEVCNHSPVAECIETSIDEWIPPTTQKVFLSDVPGFPVMAVRKYFATHISPDQKELPRKKLKPVRRRTDKCFKKELNNMLTATVTKQNTPKYDCESPGWISRCPDAQVLEAPQLHPVLGLACSEVKRCLLFSENCPPSVSETRSSWSPELFS